MDYLIEIIDYLKAKIVWICVLIGIVSFIVGSIWVYKKYRNKISFKKFYFPKKQKKKKSGEGSVHSWLSLRKIDVLIGEKETERDELCKQRDKKVDKVEDLRNQLDDIRRQDTKDENEISIRDQKIRKKERDIRKTTDDIEQISKKIAGIREDIRDARKCRDRGIFWRVAFAIYIILFIFEFTFLSSYSYGFGESESKVNIGLTLFISQVLYSIASLRQVGPKDQGEILFFGKPIADLPSGLTFIPLGFCQLEIETRLTIQDELPGEPWQIFRSADPYAPVPVRMVPPVRIPFAHPKEEFTEMEKKDPLRVRLTAEVSIIVRWRIADFKTFLSTIGSRLEARRQMNDAAVAMLTEELTKVTAAEAIQNLPYYSARLEEAIEAKIRKSSRIKTWGILLENANIKLVTLSKKINEKLLDLPAARVDAEATIVRAEAEKKAIIATDGEGKGEAELIVLTKRTQGFMNMANNLRIPMELVIAAETGRAVINTEKDKHTIILGGKGGISDLMGLAVATAEALKNQSGTSSDISEKEKLQSKATVGEKGGEL